MNCFRLKAQAVNGVWSEFTLKDLPVPVNDKQFVLMNNKNSIIYSYDTVRRGSWENGLFEGDVIDCEGIQYLICYDRGFYGISLDYCVKYFSSFKNFTVLDKADIDEGFSDIRVKYKTKHFFRCGYNIFNLQDIRGAYNGKFGIRYPSKLLDPEDCIQEVSAAYNGRRLYLGEEVEDGVVQIKDGRIMLTIKDKMVDIVNAEEKQ